MRLVLLTIEVVAVGRAWLFLPQSFKGENLVATLRRAPGQAGGGELHVRCLLVVFVHVIGPRQLALE